MDQGRLSGTGLPRDDGDPFPFLDPGDHGSECSEMIDRQEEKPGVGVQGEGILGKAVKFLIHDKSPCLDGPRNLQNQSPLSTSSAPNPLEEITITILKADIG